MKTIKHLTLLMIDAKALFSSSSSNVSIKIRAVPNNVAFKFMDGQAIWCVDKDEIHQAKKFINIIIADVKLDAGEGVLQYWGEERLGDGYFVDVVLSASQNQITELLKLSLNSQYIRLDVGGDDQDSYMDGSFTLSKEDYPINSWGIELPL